MDKQKLENLLSYYAENYDIIADINLLDKITLGEKNIYCRFCKRSYPKARFKDIAHAIPEALDNNRLFSYYECNDCNHEFGEIIENHLSKYLLPFRIGSMILGKKGKITYKIDEHNRIDVSDGHWEVKESVKNSICERIDDHTIRLKIKRQTYIPIMVYKALVKIALTIVPDDELEYLNKTIFWLKNHDRSLEDFFSQFVMMRFFPGYKPFPFIKIIIFKRKHNEIDLPIYQISLSFNNFNFQYIIPCVDKDIHLDGKTIILQSYPTPFDINTYPHPVGSVLYDFCNHNKVKNEIIPLDMHYETSENFIL